MTVLVARHDAARVEVPACPKHVNYTQSLGYDVVRTEGGHDDR